MQVQGAGNHSLLEEVELTLTHAWVLSSCDLGVGH